MTRLSAALTLILIAAQTPAGEWTAERQKLLNQELNKQIAAATKVITRGLPGVAEYSSRGDAYLFLGQFDKALADYEKMLELDPKLLPHHWRRGIALYYVGRHEEAARQFERYYEHDKVDRENGIWRYYAHVREHGVEKARSLLLPYERPDRAPLNEIYQLCEGKLTAEQVAASLNRPGASPAEQGQREFYGQLYLGLDYAAKGETAAARRHLQQAVSSDWPFTAGYGPNYMWHVGRVQLSLLDEKPDATQSPQSAREPAPAK